FAGRSSILADDCGLSRHRPFVVALFIGTRNHWPCLQELLHQIFVPASGAFFRNRFVCGGELALRIISAAVERVPLAGALLDQFAVFAQRALHSDKILLHVLTFWISA